MDKQTCARVIHALAALRDCNGDVEKAAAKLGTSPEYMTGALAEAGPNFYVDPGDGRLIPSQMGLRFATQVHVFPHVSW